MPEITAVIFMTENIRMWTSGYSITKTKLLPGHNHKRIHLSKMPKESGVCTGVVRRGKTTVLSFEKGYLFIAYQLSGKIVLLSNDIPPNTRAIFTLGNGKTLLWIDKINFGSIHWCTTLEEVKRLHQNLGPEFWPMHRSGQWWKETCSGKRAIHKVLIDQKCVAGIGNIIAIEALHRSNIHPCTPTHKLSLQQWTTLSTSIRTVVKRSLDYHDTLRKSLSEQRNFDGNLDFVSEGHTRAEGYRIYGRADELCPKCKKTNIIKGKLAGRPIYLCTLCQPNK